jgi:hypothetical protein
MAELGLKRVPGNVEEGVALLALPEGRGDCEGVTGAAEMEIGILTFV